MTKVINVENDMTELRIHGQLVAMIYAGRIDVYHSAIQRITQRPELKNCAKTIYLRNEIQ